jgi:hypothetical protein
MGHQPNLTVELHAQRDGRLGEAQPGRRGIEIQWVPARSAFEASVEMSFQNRGKAAPRS